MLEAPAPAKLNLGLHVLGRRRDGFHDVDTVFLRIPWCDRVTVSASDELAMTCSDPALPVDERNLCVKAALLLAADAGRPPGARLHLEKEVPHGAGLGGGSSDAATTLLLLLRLWGIRRDAVDLARIALELGSDVPFFLGPPVARGQGRGEVLTPLAMPPALGPVTLVVAVPPVVVSTGEAYGMIRPSDLRRADVASIVGSGPAAGWRSRLVNDFQEPVCDREPVIGLALKTLAAAGAEYCSLSGSGSAVFGLFGEVDRARRARRALEAMSCRTWVGRPGDPPDSPVLQATD
jgi:4-diphosphocytidyl-2-C-methyl-D-erythritol kinase